MEMPEVTHKDDDGQNQSNDLIPIPNTPFENTDISTVVEGVSYEPTLNMPKNEVIENNEDDLLENSLASSKKMKSSKSLKLFPSRQLRKVKFSLNHLKEKV